MRGAVLAFLAVLFCCAPARAERFVLDYTGNVLGFIEVGAVSLDVDVTDESYVIRTRLRSTGLMALFERTRLNASASGAVNAIDGAVAWRAYELDHLYSGKRRQITMARGAAALDVQITPTYRIWGTPPASEAERLASRDPLSSLVAMGVHVARHRRCSGDYPTFDGRFHYRLELRGGRIRTEFNEGGYEGPVLRCRLRYVPVSGFEAEDAGLRERIPEGEMWFALIDGSPFAPPVRAVTPLAIGEAGLHLRGFRRPTVDVLAAAGP